VFDFEIVFVWHNGGQSHTDELQIGREPDLFEMREKQRNEARLIGGSIWAASMNSLKCIH
jgi:hypothetical protein